MANGDITFDDLIAGLARKEFSPVYLFFGAEDFLAQEAANAIIEAALTPDERGFNLDVAYGSDADAREILSHSSSFPMMAERRVVVVRDFDHLQNKELFASYIEHPSATTSLVLLCTKPDFRKKPYLTARKFATLLECKPFYDNQVPPWISRRIQRTGRTIHPEAAKLLAAYVGTSLREIDSEIEKLFLFVGDKKEITIDDVTAVVGVSKEFTVFELQKAIGTKDLRRSSEVLDRMLDAGESPILIIIMLTRYFTSLWKLADLRRRREVSRAQLASEAGVHPRFLNEYVDALRRFPDNEIQDSFLLLAEADERLKSTSIDEKLIMQELIVMLQWRNGQSHS